MAKLCVLSPSHNLELCRALRAGNYTISIKNEYRDSSYCRRRIRVRFRKFRHTVSRMCSRARQIMVKSVLLSMSWRSGRCRAIQSRRPFTAGPFTAGEFTTIVYINQRSVLGQVPRLGRLSHSHTAEERDAGTTAAGAMQCQHGNRGTSRHGKPLYPLRKGRGEGTPVVSEPVVVLGLLGLGLVVSLDCAPHARHLVLREGGVGSSSSQGCSDPDRAAACISAVVVVVVVVAADGDADVWSAADALCAAPEA